MVVELFTLVMLDPTVAPHPDEQNGPLGVAMAIAVAAPSAEHAQQLFNREHGDHGKTLLTIIPRGTVTDWLEHLKRMQATRPEPMEGFVVVLFNKDDRAAAPNLSTILACSPSLRDAQQLIEAQNPEHDIHAMYAQDLLKQWLNQMDVLHETLQTIQGTQPSGMGQPQSDVHA